VAKFAAGKTILSAPLRGPLVSSNLFFICLGTVLAAAPGGFDMTKLPTTNSIGGFGCAVCASLFQTVVVALHFAYPPKDEPTAQASSLSTAAATEERRAESV
jgi:hypothetical protein